MSYINFKWVRWKNLFSYGDNWTTVALDRSPSTLVIGKNGDGKSVFFEALHIALFGVPIRNLPIKGMVVSNKNNKGLLIETCFQIGEDEYIVRRGQKPDIFEIDLNGEAMDREASVRDMQNKLNRDILRSDKIGFQITTQISKSSPIQMFMSLNSVDRRKFVDNMLESFIFTEMAKLHKSNFDVLKTEISDSSLKLARMEASAEGKADELESAREFVLTMEDRRKAAIDREVLIHEGNITSKERAIVDTERKIAEMETRVDTAQESLTAAREALDAGKEAFAKVKPPELTVDVESRQNRATKIKQFDALIMDAKVKMRSHESGVDSLNAGYCNACRQDVSEEHVANERQIIADKIEGLSLVLTEMTTKRDKLKADHESEGLEMEAHESRVREYRDHKRDLETLQTAYDRAGDNAKNAARGRDDYATALEDAKAAIEAEEAKIAKLKKAKKVKTEDPEAAEKVKTLEAQLEKLSTTLTEQKTLHDEKSAEAEYCELMTKMLKDSGIKTVIIKKYLPVINRVVNEKLAELGFFAKFSMDENFDETIMYNGVTEMAFNQFSEGQKLRINIALILAWREIARLQGRMHSNLLMFDETLDVSLDDDGYESLTEIFNRMENLNIFVISHNVDKMQGFVTSKLKFEYVDGFSRLAEKSD